MVTFAGPPPDTFLPLFRMKNSITLCLIALLAACSPSPDAAATGEAAETSSTGPTSAAPELEVAPEATEDAPAEEGTSPGGTSSKALTGEAALARLRACAGEIPTRDEFRTSRVKVQHLLVSFAGRGVGDVSRSQAEAEQLAAELFCRAEAGEDFDTLVKEHTDDSHPGIYGMVNGAATKGWYARNRMVSAFGDVGWRLQVGELGVAPFDTSASPFGWHLIRRVE